MIISNTQMKREHERSLEWPLILHVVSNCIYWIDISSAYIGSCDLNGKFLTKKVLELVSRRVFSEVVAINRHLMYFTKSSALINVNLKLMQFSQLIKNYTMNEFHILAGNMTLMHTGYGYPIQTETNEFENSNKCSHI